MDEKVAPQPPPIESAHPAIVDLLLEELPGYLGSAAAGPVCDDLRARREQGIAKYGRALQGFNGRSALIDLYQELIDALQYDRQAMYEARKTNADMSYRLLLERVFFNTLDSLQIVGRQLIDTQRRKG